MKKSVLIGLIILGILLADQALKIWVKTHFVYGESMQLLGLEWAQLYFVENPGMAFGMELGGSNGKLLLSVFRLLAVGFLAYFLIKLIKANADRSLLISFAMILAGAVGNILDSAFYGLIFSNSSFHGGLAELFPANGGYAPFLHGKVVDMLYFPVVSGNFPDWLPLLGGDPFLFFRPVFNIADVSISVGVISILLFQRHFFSATTGAEPSKTAESAEDLPQERALPAGAELKTTTTYDPPTTHSSAEEE